MSVVSNAGGSAATGVAAARLVLGTTLIGGLLLSVSLPTIAQGLNWMNIGRQTPMSQFNDKDVDLFIETGNAALRDGADGVGHTWENSESGNSGSITAARSYTQDGQSCREMLIENQSRRYFARSTHHFCENDDGTWNWVPPPRRTPSG
jgi:surface antigen